MQKTLPSNDCNTEFPFTEILSVSLLGRCLSFLRGRIWIDLSLVLFVLARDVGSNMCCNVLSLFASIRHVYVHVACSSHACMAAMRWIIDVMATKTRNKQDTVTRSSNSSKPKVGAREEIRLPFDDDVWPPAEES